MFIHPVAHNFFCIPRHIKGNGLLGGHKDKKKVEDCYSLAEKQQEAP